MKKTITILALFLTVTVFSGCATLFGAKTHPLSISSQPDGADVYVNGSRMGATPLELSLKADKSYTIEFRKEGFATVSQIVNTKVGAGWVILDILGGLVPVIVDAATGDWKKLDQKAVNATLVEQNK